MERIQKKLSETEEDKYQIWRHFGGQFAHNLKAILEENPDISAEEKAKSVLTASELSFRFGLGHFFSDFDEIQTISSIVFETVLRARLASLSPQKLTEALSIGLEKRPYCQFSFSENEEIQWQLLSSWVQLSLQQEEKTAWRPEVFLSTSLSSLGEVWLSEHLLWSDIPAMNCWYSALCGLEDIYRRHVKAADKRLRPDQIVSIEIELPHFLTDISSVKLQRLVAHYCSHYSWEDWHQMKPNELEILSRVQVNYSRQRSFEYWEKCMEAFPSLFAGVSDTLFEKYMLSGFSEKRRLRKLVQSMKYSSTKWKKPTSNVPLGFSSSVVIYTTRGGKWTSFS